MIRRSRLTRHTPLSSGRAPRTGNPVRRKREWLRAYGSEERTAWVKTLPCIVSGCVSPSENMHVKGDGAGRKADAKWIIPACRAHHRQAHRVGIRTFAEMHYLDLEAIAAQVDAAWQRSSSILATLIEETDA